MKTPALIFVLAAFFTGPIVLGAADSSGSGNQSPCEAAFGFESFRLGGVYGAHAETLMKGNLLRLDMEKDFLEPFRKRTDPKKTYIGLGKTLDAAVHLAASTNAPELTAWKDKWIAEMIRTIDTDGYIGLSPRGAPAEWSKFGFHERGAIILALTNDYRYFGHRKSLEAAQQIAENLLATWPVDMNSPRKLLLWTVEYPLIRLSEVSGDPKYIHFVRSRFFNGDKLDPQWSYAMLPMQGHVYGWCDDVINMLDLHRHYPHPVLTSAWPQMIDWLKDGGSLPTGEFCETERWTRGQPTRDCSVETETSAPLLPTKVGESCAKFYMVQLLDRLNQLKPDVFYSDVIERTYYNGLFAAMSPEGRQLCYSLSVEGTRSYWHVDTYCCPGNLRRAFAYLPRYFYTLGKGTISVNLYGESEARLKLPEGKTLTLTQKTRYPETGKIRFSVAPSDPVQQSFSFRIPAWCKKPTVLLNGQPVAHIPSPGTFLTIDRQWVAGDTLELDFPMEWRWISGIRTKRGTAALARGPVVYSLDPWASTLDYHDAPRNIKPVEADKAHQAAHARLEQITLNPDSVSEPKPGKSGFTAEVRGWLGRAGESPEKTFVFRTFEQPEGRKIYFKLSRPEVAIKDELFASALHEDTVYPSRWEKIKTAIHEASLRHTSLANLKHLARITPQFGAHDSETAEGEIAGQTAWMSAVTPPEAKRRMNFRVSNPHFTNGTCPNVLLTIAYLDFGDARISIAYDALVSEKKSTGENKGTTKIAGVISLGHSGEIRTQDFALDNVRFGKGVKPGDSDFSLISDTGTDFVILGAYLRERD